MLLKIDCNKNLLVSYLCRFEDARARGKCLPRAGHIALTKARWDAVRGRAFCIRYPASLSRLRRSSDPRARFDWRRAFV